MAAIDKKRFDVFARRCYIDSNACLVIKIDEYKEPMILTDPLDPDLANSKPDSDTILDILRGELE
jgi:hypothetical protein